MHNANRQQIRPTPQKPVSTSIDWYGRGQSKVVEFSGVHLTVRYVGRKGRRARIAITAPAGAVIQFEATEPSRSAR